MKGQSIGRKIKALRTKLNEENKDIYISQDALYKDHQGLISQIEGEKIIHPNRETLEIVAKNLGISLEELIEDTNWDPKKAKVITSEYAFSRTQAMVKLDESGQIHITMQSYPRYNEKGDENMFSPETGERLISTCENRDWRTDSEDLAEEPCGRSIESATQRHCMSCGYSLLPAVQLSIIEKRDFWHNLDSNESEQERIQGWIDTGHNEMIELLQLSDPYELGERVLPVSQAYDEPPTIIFPS